MLVLSVFIVQCLGAHSLIPRNRHFNNAQRNLLAYYPCCFIWTWRDNNTPLNLLASRSISSGCVTAELRCTDHTESS